MRHPAALAVGLALLPASGLAVADEVAVRVPDGPPPVLCVSESLRGTDPVRLARYAPDGTATVILDHMPLSSVDLAVEPASGRWAFAYTQVGDDDPLTIDGKAVSKYLDRNTLVLGDNSGPVAAVYGDPACTSKVHACFEQAMQFSVDGTFLFVKSLASRWTSVSRWTYGKKPKRVTVASKKVGNLALAPDGTRAAYVAKDGVHVTAFPEGKKKAVAVKVTKSPVATPDLLISDVQLLGDRVYWLRREPTEQKRGWYEAFDLTTKQTITLREATADFPMMDGQFLSTGPRGSVVFLDGPDHDVYEQSGDQPAARITTKVVKLLDVSRDGRYLLVTRRQDGTLADLAANPELVVIFDLVTQTDVATIDTGGEAREIVDAAFTAAP